MSTTIETKNPAAELLADNVRIFLQVSSALDQCDDEIRAVVRDMMAICRDESATEDEHKRALNTIVEALFPMLAADFVASRHRVRRMPGAEERDQAMDAEEATFAGRVAAIMQERAMTQEQLATAVGVSQSAISNMLNRQCRPQRKTVAKIAKALDVAPEMLWPNYAAE